MTHRGHLHTVPGEQCDCHAQSSEMKDFLLVLRQALLMIVAWIEKKYGLKR